MTTNFYTDRELAELLGVSVSLVRKLAKFGPSRPGPGVLDIRLIPCFRVGDMRRWDAGAANRLLGISVSDDPTRNKHKKGEKMTRLNTEAGHGV